MLVGGGYVCAPVVVAAWALRVPVFTLCVDVAPGWAVRVAARLSTRVARTLEGEAGFNDPIAILLVVGFVGVLTKPGYGAGDFVVLFVRELGMHLTFLALTDNLAHAVRLLERHLAWALEKEGHARRFDFFLAARFLLDRLEAAGKAAVRLRLPQGFPVRSEGGNRGIDCSRAWAVCGFLMTSKYARTRRSAG